MRTVSSRVNDKEFEAIAEYANQCGETVSNVLKKGVFEWVALSQEGCPEGYRLNRLIPEGMDEDALLSKNVNKIRQFLGWDEVVLVNPKSTDVKESNEQPTPADKEEPMLHLKVSDVRNILHKELRPFLKQLDELNASHSS